MILSRFTLALLVSLTAHSMAAHAGPYNFSDILPGDRAMGMGGAFGAVADDSSALFYNPAGLALAVSSQVSASVNALQFTSREYQNLFNNRDSFYEQSQDIVPTFTGGVLDLSKYGDSLHGAFNLQTLTQQSSNQNDILRRPDISLEYFHRSSKAQTSELLFGVGVGRRVGHNWAVGLSLGGRQAVQDTQIYQDVSQSIQPALVQLKTSVAEQKSLFSTLTTNERATAQTMAAEVGAGVLWSPRPSLSMGLSAHFDLLVTQSLAVETDSLSLFHYNDYSLPLADDFEIREGANAEDAQNNIEKYSNKKVARRTSNNQMNQLKTDAPAAYTNKEFGVEPGRSRVRFGLAYFPTPRLVVAGDVIWHRSLTEWVISRGLTTEDVLNLHLGSEYFLTPRFFIRNGFFTNFDARPRELSAANPERIDFYGASFFGGTQTADTQFSGGLVYQMGIGEALKVAGQSVPKPVNENRYTLAFTATHGL